MVPEREPSIIKDSRISERLKDLGFVLVDKVHGLFIYHKKIDALNDVLKLSIDERTTSLSFLNPKTTEEFALANRYEVNTENELEYLITKCARVKAYFLDDQAPV